MEFAYCGLIKSLNSIISDGSFVSQLTSNFKNAYSRIPSQSEIRSWEFSIPEFVNLLMAHDLSEFHIIIEYRLPFDGERCDVILLGKYNDRIKAIVIELKQWSKIYFYKQSSEIVFASGLGAHSHPSYQASNYSGKIKNFHSSSRLIDIEAACFLHNINSGNEAYKILNDNRFEQILYLAPIYANDQAADLANFIKMNIGTESCDANSLNIFCNGQYTQSKQFFDGIIENAKYIAQKVEHRVIGSGWGLTNAQLKLKNEVLTSLNEGNRILFLIKGEPGSGKSLLAIHLLLELLSIRINVVLGMVNNRLMTALKHCLDTSYPGSSGALKYFTPRFGEGLANSPQDRTFDVVICDEGQRMQRREMSPILNRAPIIVVFYDESQILLPVEQGTKEQFNIAANQLNIIVREHSLPTNYRCKGGELYQTWVETLLTSPSDVKDRKLIDWRRKYDFRIFSNLQEMINALQLKQTETQKDVALIASFTESDGRGNNIIRTENPRLIWAMKGPEYINFWVDKGSNRLDMCASIFGCQGFERSYCGIIWGKDYSIRGNRWVVPNDHTITDYIGRPSLSQLVSQNKREEASQLLYNRYRVLLTRGIDGTYIFCEDEETLEFLRNLNI